MSHDSSRSTVRRHHYTSTSVKPKSSGSGTQNQLIEFPQTTTAKTNDHLIIMTQNQTQNTTSSPATGIAYPYYNPYVHITPAPPKPTNTLTGSLTQLGRKVEDATKKAEHMLGNIYHHLRAAPSVTDVAVARTKMLADGGYNKSFHQAFGYCISGETLIDAYACYLSTATGPLMGTLYISNKRMAFCSDRPVYYGGGGGAHVHASVPPGQVDNKSYYQVVVPVEQLKAVYPSCNPLDHSKKYIVVQTKDGQEFWFMGFILYDKALKNSYKAMQQGYK